MRREQLDGVSDALACRLLGFGSPAPLPRRRHARALRVPAVPLAWFALPRAGSVGTYAQWYPVASGSTCETLAKAIARLLPMSMIAERDG